MYSTPIQCYQYSAYIGSYLHAKSPSSSYIIRYDSRVGQRDGQTGKQADTWRLESTDVATMYAGTEYLDTRYQILRTQCTIASASCLAVYSVVDRQLILLFFFWLTDNSSLYFVLRSRYRACMVSSLLYHYSFSDWFTHKLTVNSMVNYQLWFISPQLLL